MLENSRYRLSSQFVAPSRLRAAGALAECQSQLYSARPHVDLRSFVYEYARVSHLYIYIKMLDATAGLRPRHRGPPSPHRRFESQSSGNRSSNIPVLLDMTASVYCEWCAFTTHGVEEIIK